MGVCAREFACLWHVIKLKVVRSEQAIAFRGIKMLHSTPIAPPSHAFPARVSRNVLQSARDIAGHGNSLNAFAANLYNLQFSPIDSAEKYARETAGACACKCDAYTQSAAQLKLKQRVDMVAARCWPRGN